MRESVNVDNVACAHDLKVKDGYFLLYYVRLLRCAHARKQRFQQLGRWADGRPARPPSALIQKANRLRTHIAVRKFHTRPCVCSKGSRGAVYPKYSAFLGTAREC